MALIRRTAEELLMSTNNIWFHGEEKYLASYLELWGMYAWQALACAEQPLLWKGLWHMTTSISTKLLPHLKCLHHLFQCRLTYKAEDNILIFFFFWEKSLIFDVCLCWGFTAQSTQWGHVERGQFVCLCWGFTAQSSQWGHVERGQFTLPQVYWAGLVL